MKDEDAKHWVQEKAFGILLLFCAAVGSAALSLCVIYIKDIKEDVSILSTSFTNMTEKMNERLNVVQDNQTKGGIVVSEKLQSFNSDLKLVEQRTTRLEIEVEKLKEQK